MRIMYVGLDKRTRVADALRVRFLQDGFQPSDRAGETIDGTHGPVIVVHLLRVKGGKRLIMSVPERFDMLEQELHLLREGWINLAECTVVAENLY